MTVIVMVHLIVCLVHFSSRERLDRSADDQPALHRNLVNRRALNLDDNLLERAHAGQLLRNGKKRRSLSIVFENIGVFRHKSYVIKSKLFCISAQLLAIPIAPHTIDDNVILHRRALVVPDCDLLDLDQGCQPPTRQIRYKNKVVDAMDGAAIYLFDAGLAVDQCQVVFA